MVSIGTSTPDNSILSFYLTGTDSTFGLPACCFFYANAPTCRYIQEVYSIPLEENGVFNVSDMNDLIRNINQILSYTHVPVFPLIFTHFCLPFSPICLKGYCEYERGNELKELLKEVNSRISPHGIHFELASSPQASHISLNLPFLFLCRHGEGISLATNSNQAITSQPHPTPSAPFETPDTNTGYQPSPYSMQEPIPAVSQEAIPLAEVYHE